MSIPQAEGVYGDDERQVIYDHLDSPEREMAIEQLACIITDFADNLTAGNAEAVKNECDRLIEWCFLHSRAYQIALSIYANRFNSRGPSNPAELFQEVFDHYIGNKSEGVQ